MLKVENLKVSYGELIAVREASFEVNKGEMVALVGSNGAGKTTILKTISGLLKPDIGSVTFKGNNLLEKTPQDIVKLGLCQVPEGRHLFPEMSVKENLEIGAITLKDKNKFKNNLEKIYGYFPRLEERRKQKAGSLSGGEQQMLAVSRALMSSPDLMIFDEPSLGLAPILVQNLFEIIDKINKNDNTTIILIEQNVKSSLKLCDRGYVIENGKITMSGNSEELLNDDHIREAFLGV